MDVKLDCSRYKNIFMMKINPDKVGNCSLIARSLYITNPLGKCDLSMLLLKYLYLEMTSISLYSGFQA